MQTRYLTVLLPPLALLSAPLVVSSWESVHDARTRRALGAVFVWALMWCAWMPGQTWDRYRVLQVLALERVGSFCHEKGITEVDFPAPWRLEMPAELLGESPVAHYRKPQSPGAAAAAQEWLEQGGERAMYVPRGPFQEMERAMRFGEDVLAVAYPGDATLTSVLRHARYEEHAISVPYDSLHVWLERLGIRTRGHLVGVLFVRPSP